MCGGETNSTPFLCVPLIIYSDSMKNAVQFQSLLMPRQFKEQTILFPLDKLLNRIQPASDVTVRVCVPRCIQERREEGGEEGGGREGGGKAISSNLINMLISPLLFNSASRLLFTKLTADSKTD